MKKLMIATMLCGSLVLGGCATSGDGTVTPDQQKIDLLIAGVQEYAAKACNFLPTASAVVEVIGAFSGTPGIGVTVGQIGGAICSGFVTRQSGVGGTIVRNVNTPKGIIKVSGTRVK